MGEFGPIFHFVSSPARSEAISGGRGRLPRGCRQRSTTFPWPRKQKAQQSEYSGFSNFNSSFSQSTLKKEFTFYVDLNKDKQYPRTGSQSGEFMVYLNALGIT